MVFSRFRHIARWAACAFVGFWSFTSAGQDAAPIGSSDREPLLDSRALEIRARYESSLLRSPFQEQAFEQTYRGYMDAEGVSAWIDALEASLESSEDAKSARLIVLGRIHTRQLDTRAAIESFEAARQEGAQEPELLYLLANAFADAGRFADAVPLLEEAVNTLDDTEKRSGAARLLGDLHLRQGNQVAAITAWKRLVELALGDAFVFWDLAGIYEDYGLWREAVTTYEDIAARAASDPYAQCRALRGKGRALTRLDEHEAAAAAFEQALSLAAPGNWLFDDLKQQLIAVYEDLGDLGGLAAYARAQIDATPAAIEYRELLAETCVRLGDEAQAEIAYRELLDRAPDHVSAYEALVRLYERTERVEEAAETLRALIARVPSDTDYVRRLGELYLDASEPEKALDAWRSIVADDSDPHRFAELAGWLAQHEFDDEAIDAYRQALAGSPDKTWALRLADLYHDRGDDEAAIAAWESILTEDSGAAEYAEVASLLRSNGFKERAETHYRTALTKDPGNAEASHELADLLAEGERWEEATVLYEGIARNAETDYWRMRGERSLFNAYKSQGELQERQAEWEQAVAASPDDLDANQRLARLYEVTGHFQRAIELYTRCAELAPEDATHQEALAQTYARAGRNHDAATTYESLITEHPSRARAYLRELMTLYARLNNMEAEVRAAERIVELAPEDAESRAQLAQTYQSRGRADEALIQFRHAIRLEPEQAAYHIQFGQALMGLQRWGDANEAFQRLLEQTEDPNTRLEGIRHLAQIHLQFNTIDKLIREYEDRIRSTPKRLAAYTELAAIHEAVGDPSKHIETLERARQEVDDREDLLHALLAAANTANDLGKVIAYSEELLAISREPDLYELERLGRAYAEFGDLDRAQAAWSRISAAHPDDPRALLLEADARWDAGLIESAFGLKERALALDPYDHRLRFALAREFAEQGEASKALEHFQRILDLGEAPGTAADTAIANLTGTPPTASSHAQLRVAFGQMPPSLRGKATTFRDFRAQVVMQMIAVARQYEDLDAVIERFEAAHEADPGSEIARDDLLAAYESTNRIDDVVALTTASLDARPDDAALLNRLGMLYQRRNRFDEAVGVYERMINLEPDRHKELSMLLLQLQSRAGDQGAALENARGLYETYPDDVSIALQFAHLLEQSNDAAAAEPVLRKLIESEQSNAEQIQLQIAEFLKRNGRMDEARGLFEALLFGETKSAAPQPSPAARQSVYMVSGQRSFGQGPNAFANTLRQLFPSLGYTKVLALNGLQSEELDVGPESASSTFSRLREDAETALNGAKANAAAPDSAKLYFAHLLTAGDQEAAAAWLERLLAAFETDLELYHARLWMQEQDQDFTAVLETYDRITELGLANADSIEQGQLNVMLLEGAFDRAGELILAGVERGAPINKTIGDVQRLYGSGGKQAAKTVLETVLTDQSRHPQGLLLLSRIYADDRDFDRAIALAREVWEGNTATAAPMGFGFRTGRTNPNASLSTQALQSLNSYYAQTGRRDVLAAELKAKVDAHPTSTALRINLATAYQWSGKPELAQREYERILELRPRDTNTKMALAQLYQQSGQNAKAVEIYESLLQSQPGLYNNLSGYLRPLYESLGRNSDLDAIEDKVVRRATNSGEIQVMASQAQSRGDHERALELYKRILSMEPENTHVQHAVADVYMTLGRLDEARAAYDGLLDLSRIHQGGNLLLPQIKAIVDCYARTDGVDALRERAKSWGAGAAESRLAARVEAAIARHEGRNQDAIDILRELWAKEKRDDYVREILELAKEMEDYALAIEVLEQASDAGQPQYLNDLAELYLKQDNREAAANALTRLATRDGNSYNVLHGLQRMLQLGLHESAETLYMENRRHFRNPQVGRSADYEIVRAFLQGKGFETAVKEDILIPDNPQLQEVLSVFMEGGSDSQVRAGQILGALAEQMPDVVPVQAQYAQLLNNAGRFAEAAEVFERVVALAPDVSNYRSQYASVLSQLNRREEVVEMLGEWAAAQPTRERVQLLLGHLNNVDSADAYTALRDAILSKVGAKDQQAIRAMFAHLDARFGDPAAAGEALRGRFESEAGGDAFREYFNHLVQYQSAEEAIALLDAYRGTEMFEARSVPLDQALRAYFQVEDERGADAFVLQVLKSAGQWDVDNIVQQAATVYKEDGHWVRFERMMRDAVESPEDAHPFLARSLASYFLNSGRIDDALAMCERLFTKDDAPAEAIQLKVRILETGKRHEALVAYLESLPAPGQEYLEWERQIALARAFHELGQTEERDAVIAVLKDNTNAEALNHTLVQFYHAIGERAKLRELLEPMIEEPDYNGAMVHLLAEAYVEDGRVEDAVALWERWPDHTESTLIQSLIDRKEYAAAAPVLQRAMERQPSDTWKVIQLATVSMMSGDRDVAFRVFEGAYEQISPVHEIPVNSSGPNESLGARGRSAGAAGESSRTRTALQNIGVHAPPIVEQYKNFLLEHDLVGPALAHESLPESGALGGALVRCFAHAAQRDDDDMVELIRPHLEQLRLDFGEDVSFVAKGFERIGDSEAAIKWYRRAAEQEGLDGAYIAELASSMTRLGDAAGALDLLEIAAASSPAELLQFTEFFEVLGQAEDRARADALMEQICAAAPNEGAAGYARGRYLYSSDRKDEAYALMASLMGVPRLTFSQIQSIENFLSAGKHYAEALQFAERVIDGPFPIEQQKDATGRAVAYTVLLEQFDKAVAYFAEVMSERRQRSGDVRKDVLQLVDEERFDDFVEAVERFIETHPEHAGIGELNAIKEELTRKHDRALNLQSSQGG